jgi:RND superfamily putative drug exporter
VLGLGIGAALIGLVMPVLDIPDWGPQLAAMMALGVGIDYVLLMVTRYRELLGAGLLPAEATVATVETAGRSVLVAGTTVVISMFGLFATGLGYMQGAAVATIMSVFVIMVRRGHAPACTAGVRRSPHRPPAAARHPATAAPPARRCGRRWARWCSAGRGRRCSRDRGRCCSWRCPFLDVRFGFPDFGNSPADTSSRQTYDLVSDGFGPGANGPLLVVAALDGAADDALGALRERLAGHAGCGRRQRAGPQPGRRGGAAHRAAVDLAAGPGHGGPRPSGARRRSCRRPAAAASRRCTSAARPRWPST